MRSRLTLMIRLLPSAFRERFGAELEAQIDADHRAARARGFLPSCLFVARTALDLLRTAIVERWDPTFEGTRKRVETMTTLEEIGVDIGHALRSLRRAPAFTAMAVGTLALAIGALAAVYSVVDAVILRPLPFTDADRIVFVVGVAPGVRDGEIGASPEMYLEYKNARLLEHVSSQGYGGTRTLRVGDRAERIAMWFPTPSLFQALGVEPELGRLPTAEDDGKVVLLSHRLWTILFDSDPDVIGRTVEADGVPRTVIGVMKRDFWWLNDGFLLWVPQEITPQTISEPGRFEIRLVGRMAAGATAEQVADELTGLARRLPERYGGSPEYARTIEHHRAVVRPIEANLPTRNALGLWALFGSALIVLLIACANVANLFLVRAERKQHDHAVRRAVGGTRTRLIRVTFAESFAVALLGGALGVALSQVRAPFLTRAAASAFDRVAPFQLLTSVAFALSASLFAGLFCGAIPALRAAAPRVMALRETRVRSRRQHWTQNALIVAQTSLALVLLIGSALLARSFWELHGIELGYESRDVLSFQVAPVSASLVDGPAYARFHLDFMDRIAALPDVQSVGIVNSVPLDDPVAQLRVFRVEDLPGASGGVEVSYTNSAGAYFASMGIRLIEGRDFTRDEQTSNPGSVLVSRAAAELLWPGKPPLGQRIRRDDSDEWHTVVGVVGDVRYDPLEAPPPLIYFPLAGPTPTSWRVSSPGFVVRTPRADVIAPEIRELVAREAPGAPMYAISTMEERTAGEYGRVRLMMQLLAAGALLSLLLSAIGLFGVLSYVVAERTREIGVRIALGADGAAVRGMVVRQGSLVVAAGVGLGLGVAAFSTRALQTITSESSGAGLLFGVRPLDVLSFATMSVLMLSVGWLASWLPASRASHVDPIEALRGS